MSNMADFMRAMDAEFDPAEHPHAPAGTSEGGQFTSTGGGGGSTKPTSASAKGSKAAVHELLSSGHSFTFAELLKITGAKEKAVKNALSELKNPKWAGPKGALQIVKDPSGGYYVKAGEAMSAGIPTMPGKPLSKIPSLNPPITQPAAPAAPAVPAELTGAWLTTETWEEKLTAPAEKMPKEKADMFYNESLKNFGWNLVKELAKDPADGGALAMLSFKVSRHTAMMQWKANTTGEDQKTQPQKLFFADKEMVSAMEAGGDFDFVFSQWKKNTAAEKAGNFPPKQQAAAAQIAALPVSTELLSCFGNAKIADDYAQVSGKDYDRAEPTSKSAYEKGWSKTKAAFNKNLESGAQKAEIEKNLEARLAKSEAFLAVSKYSSDYGNSLVRKLVGNWAGSSGNGNNRSVAMQLAVRDAFGMGKEDVEHSPLHAINSAGGDEEKVVANAAKELGYPGDINVFKAALRDFVSAQYANTQEHLKAKGVKDVYVARGMAVGSGTQSANLVNLRLQPASSFSTNYGTARGFSHGKSVFMVKVPASQVLGSFNTGFGCMNENEVVVLASPNMKAVQIGKNTASSLSEATAHVGSQVKGW